MTTDLAVPATGRDAGVPWHFGDPLREQRLLSTGAGVIDRSNRDLLVVPGVDRLGWLHSICSQHLTSLTDGDSTEALVLSPHGHVEQHWQVTELDGKVWLDTEPGEAPVVLDYLRKMQFLKRVEPADVSTEWAVLSLVGPATPTVLALARLPVPEPAGRAEALHDGGFVRRMSVLCLTGAWCGDCINQCPTFDRAENPLTRIGEASRVGRVDRHVHAAADVLRYHAELDLDPRHRAALRVEARRPRFGFETDHRTIPHEVDWIGTAVHLDKGCYRGQETVARVQNLGKPPRRLVFVHFGGESDTLPAAGSPIDVDGRTVGFLGTAIHHYELGPIGLAVVKRTLAEDAVMAIDGQTAALDQL